MAVPKETGETYIAVVFFMTAVYSQVFTLSYCIPSRPRMAKVEREKLTNEIPTLALGACQGAPLALCWEGAGESMSLNCKGQGGERRGTTWCGDIRTRGEGLCRGPLSGYRLKIPKNPELCKKRCEYTAKKSDKKHFSLSRVSVC